MWSNEKVLKLIKDYHASYCLWDVTSPDYKNRVKKKKALESLAAKHNVTLVDIEKKIHNLKTSFNRERKKISTSGIYTKNSTWFAFEYLQFLLPANEAKGNRNKDLIYIESGNNVYENSLLDTGDSQEQALNVNVEHKDNRPPFKTPRNPPKYIRRNEDSSAQQAVSCMKSLSEMVTTRDENSVFGEYVANKMRNCNRPRVEVSLAQSYVNDILFRLDMGLLAAEIPSIQTSHTPSPSYVSQDSYCSNPSTPAAGDTEGAGDV